MSDTPLLPFIYLAGGGFTTFPLEQNDKSFYRGIRNVNIWTFQTQAIRNDDFIKVRVGTK